MPPPYERVARTACAQAEPADAAFDRRTLLAWGVVLAGSVAAASAPVAGAARLLDQAGSASVDLSKFGAAGDGATNDTAALARALDSVASDGTVASAAGRSYVISAPLVIRRPCTLDFRGSRLVKSASMRGPAIVVAAPGVTLRNLQVDGNRAAGARGGGIEWRAPRGRLVGVTVRRCHGDGIATLDRKASIEASGCAASDNAGTGTARGFSIVVGAAKLHGCTANDNESCGFFFNVDADEGCHVDGSARGNYMGSHIRSRGGTSRRLVVDGNERYGLVMDSVGGYPRSGGWKFGVVRCSRTGVRVDRTGTGLQMIGSDRNTFGNVISTANPGYGLAIAGGSSHNVFRKVLCDAAGSGDGDPGIHFSGGASHNRIANADVRNHTFGVIFGEGYKPLNNDFNTIDRLTVTRCSWGALKIESGSNNRVGHLISRRNKAIDVTLAKGVVDFWNEASNNVIDFLDHRNPGIPERENPQYVVHANARSRGNKIRRGAPLAALRSQTHDASGNNSFFT